MGWIIKVLFLAGIKIFSLLLTFKNLAATLRTTRFKTQKFYMALALVECFVRISEKTATFVLYSIDWLVFITVVGSVYCVVQTDSLYKTDYVPS